MVEIKEGERKRKGLSLSLTLRDFFFFFEVVHRGVYNLRIDKVVVCQQPEIYIYIWTQSTTDNNELISCFRCAADFCYLYHILYDAIQSSTVQ